jgi:hypothetical protein
MTLLGIPRSEWFSVTFRVVLSCGECLVTNLVLHGEVVQCVNFVENGSQFVWYYSSMAKPVEYVALVALVTPKLSLCQPRMVLVVVVHLACGYFAHSSSVTRSFASLQSMGVKNCVVSTVAQLMLFDQSFALWMRYVQFYVAFLSFLAKVLVCLLFEVPKSLPVVCLLIYIKSGEICGVSDPRRGAPMFRQTIGLFPITIMSSIMNGNGGSIKK